MSNWLTPIKQAMDVAGHLGLARHDTRKIISEGADMIMKQLRTDLIPRFHYSVPVGVSVLNDEQMLEVFLAGIISRAVRTAEWRTERFAYPAKQFSRIEQSPPWRSLMGGLARHDHHPILITERDVYYFNGLDWHIGQLKIGIGLG